jgi:hypothetical protein
MAKNKQLRAALSSCYNSGRIFLYFYGVLHKMNNVFRNTAKKGKRNFDLINRIEMLDEFVSFRFSLFIKPKVI